MQLVMVGELTLDDVIVEDQGCFWKQLGGGALYSAVGARVWTPGVGISGVVGSDYPLEMLRVLREAGVSVSGITRMEGGSLGVWLLYEIDGRRHQLRKGSAPAIEAFDRRRSPWVTVYGEVDGVHIAPQSTEGQILALQQARGRTNIISQDVMVEPSVNPGQYRRGEAIAGTTDFLPSEEDVRHVWGSKRPSQLFDELRGTAGISRMVIKRGAAGVDVVSAAGITHVPAVPVEVEDATGAGDAFCGGYLAGLVRTGDVVEAAIYGVVSASFVVGTRGALAALSETDPVVALRRAAGVRAATEGIVRDD